MGSLALSLRLHLGAGRHPAEPILVCPNPTFPSAVVQWSRASCVSCPDTYHHTVGLWAGFAVLSDPVECAIQQYRRYQCMVRSEIHQLGLVHDDLPEYDGISGTVLCIWNCNLLQHLDELLRN